MTGQYHHSIDNKGRLFIPARLREELGETFYVAIGMGKCLAIYSDECWAGVTAQLDSLPYSKTRDAMRMLYANAVKCEPDTQGRIVLPQRLRKYLFIDRLERSRVILRYAPTINWDKTDRERVEAMIQVNVTPQRDKGFDEVAGRIYRFEEVKSVYLMSGGYDLMVMLKARTLKQLALFVAEKLSTIEGVMSTATHFVLKKYKNEGVIMDETAVDDRLQVSP